MCVNSANLTFGLMWQFLAAIIYIPFLIWALRKLPFSALIAEPRLQHMLYAAVLILALTWSFRAGLSDGLSVHFLGLTTLTLLFGWDLALVVGSAALLLTTLVGVEPWPMFWVNLLTKVLVPAAVTLLILRQVEQRMTRNFFVYLFVVTFIGGGITVASSGLSLAVLLGIAGVHDWGKIYLEYILYLPLIMLPEGLINGIIMTGLMVFHPDWIRTFDARLYIDEQ